MPRIIPLAAAPLLLAAVLLPGVSSAVAADLAATPGTVLATIPTGPTPQDVVVSPDGRFAYVTTLDDGVLAEIDLTTFAATRSVDIGETAGAVIWRNDGLLVADAAGHRLVIVDPSSLTVSGPLILDGADPIALSASADGDVVAFSNAGQHTIGVLDDANQYLSYVAIDGTPWGVDLFDGDTRAIIANQTQGRLEISTLGTADTSPALVGSIPVGGRPSYIAVSPDERFAYAANADRGAVDVVDLSSLTVVASYDVGGKPWGVAVSSDGDYLYIPDNSNGIVTAVDAAGGRVLSQTATGTHPDFVALSPDGTLVLVPNSGSNTLTIVQGHSVPAATGTETATGTTDGSGTSGSTSSSSGGVNPAVVVGAIVGGIVVLGGIGFVVYTLMRRAAATSAAALVGPGVPPPSLGNLAPLPHLDIPRRRPEIDPTATPEQLAEYATKPEYRPAVAAHPNAYPDLLVWLGSLGEPEVDAALRVRGA